MEEHKVTIAGKEF